LLIYYKNQSFILPDGALNTVPNPKIFSAMLELKGLLLNNTYQNVNDIIIYPKDFFSPKDFETSKITITKNTRAINHFSASWLPWSIIIKLKLKTLLLNLVGKNTFYKIKNWINVL
jgi:hypothetical protein